MKHTFDHLKGRVPGFADAGQRAFAVLAPYLPETGELLFEVRAGTLKRQPGEICFPGGAIEAGESPQAAAVRETGEELLVRDDQIEVLAPLDRIVTSSGGLVHPFLATLRGYQNTFGPGEVAEVFRVPFAFFLQTEPLVVYNQTITRPADDFPYALLGIDAYPWATVPAPVVFYRYEGRVIWGMTAKIVRNLVMLQQTK